MYISKCANCKKCTGAFIRCQLDTNVLFKVCKLQKNGTGAFIGCQIDVISKVKIMCYAPKIGWPCMYTCILTLILTDQFTYKWTINAFCSSLAHSTIPRPDNTHAKVSSYPKFGIPTCTCSKNVLFKVSRPGIWNFELITNSFLTFL